MKIKELLEKCNDVINGSRDKITEVNSNECDYEKDYMKTKFNSDDDLPLNKSLKFCLMTITIRNVFQEDGKLYPQKSIDSKNIDIIYIKGNAYRIHFWYMSKHKRKRKRKAISVMTKCNLIDKKGIL